MQVKGVYSETNELFIHNTIYTAEESWLHEKCTAFIIRSEEDDRVKY